MGGADFPPTEQIPFVLLAAFLSTASLLLLSWAYARAEASYLAATEYTSFLWAMLFGWLVFGETVSLFTLAGAALIVAGCFLAARTPQEANPSLTRLRPDGLALPDPRRPVRGRLHHLAALRRRLPQPALDVAFLVSVAISMGLLELAARTIPMGTAYAVWGGIGAVGTVIVGMIWFHEPATTVRLLLILGDRRLHRRAEDDRLASRSMLGSPWRKSSSPADPSACHRVVAQMYRVPFSLTGAAVGLCSRALRSARQEAPPPPPTAVRDAADDISERRVRGDEEIVVVGQKPRGSVVGDIPPENVLTSRDIRATGATSISELLDAIAPQTGSARGRGGGRPILLLNGQRISGFREMRDLPPEAIERMEILPEEVALKYGYAADQRVVNIVLRRRFNSTNVELGGRIATDGGYASARGDGGRLTIARRHAHLAQPPSRRQ